MAKPPERDKDTIDVCDQKADIHRVFGNVFSGQRQKTSVNSVKPKKGSKKYLHLQKFIQKRRQKKLEKRCTLDLSAQVFLSIE